MSELNLSLDDLLPKQRSTPDILKLRTTHHEMARLLALGLKDIDISRVMGYSQSRICILKKDPMVKELIAHYMGLRDRIVTDVGGRLESLSVTALEIIQERMLDDPDSLTMKDLQGVAELSLDRSGHGKQSVVANVNVSVQTLSAIKSQIEREHRGRVLSRSSELEVVDADFTPVVHPEGEETAEGGASGTGVRGEGP
jgi:hypothetical protein